MIPEFQTFLEDWQQKNNRPLRVLHIGNIANNAYNNAKIQRNYGIEADVVGYSDYYIMSSPEWEDANVNGDVGDPFFPDWWAVELGDDWERPDWFVQGPVEECMAYLRCRHLGDAKGMAYYRLALITAYWNLLAARTAGKGQRREGSPLAPRFEINSRKLGLAAPNHRAKLWGRWLFTVARMRQQGSGLELRRLIQYLRHELLFPSYVLQRSGGDTDLIDRALAKFESLVQRYRGKSLSLPQGYALKTTQKSTASLYFAGCFVKWALAQPFRIRVPWLAEHAATGASISPVLPTDEDIATREKQLRDLWISHFGAERSEEISKDMIFARNYSFLWRDVMDYYDIVQGYSTDGIIPRYWGFNNMVAYEHGTLRQIPFDDDTRGRLCCITYCAAPKIFVTNTDVLPSVERLKIPRDRVVYLPHAFNDGKLRKFRADNPELQPPADRVVFFSPTRHHWSEGDLSWRKGNDALLRAAAGLLGSAVPFELVLVEWGKEVALSRKLIDDLGLTSHVTWLPPMKKRELWSRYLRSHVIVDQFSIPAIGGVAFETLTLGRRLITRIDAPTLDLFFGKAPPLLNASSATEIEVHLRSVLADPTDQAGAGQAGSEWIATYHSAERTVGLQVAAYCDLLRRSRP